MSKKVERELRGYIVDNRKELSELRKEISSLKERINDNSLTIKYIDNMTLELFTLSEVKIMRKAEKLKQLIKVRNPQNEDTNEEIKKLEEELEILKGE